MVDSVGDQFHSLALKLMSFAVASSLILLLRSNV
jgi:hypothetical protein